MITAVTLNLITFAACLSGIITTPLWIIHQAGRARTAADAVLIPAAGFLFAVWLFTTGCTAYQNAMQALRFVLMTSGVNL